MIKIDIKKKLNTADGEIVLEVSKEINSGDFLTLFGKSGSGKTTLLRIISGLETPSSGEIVVDGEIWFSSTKNINLSPQKRNVGFVFQDYALFPNMSVRQNLEFALKDKKKIKKIGEILEIMEIQNLSKMKPEHLSGGQKQRVALARALMADPKILLLDEPLSALDYEMRLKLQDELVVVHEKFNITSVLVSHDIDEVFRLSNRVFKISSGLITDDGAPDKVFLSAKNKEEPKITAEVLSIEKNDTLYMLELVSNGEIIKLSTTLQDFQNIKSGDKITISKK